MKRTFFIMLLFLAASPLLADPPDEDVLRPRLGGHIGLFVQFNLGLNLNFLDGNPYVRPLFTSYEQETAIYRSAFGLGPLAGIDVGYEFSSHFGLVLGVAYDGRSASNSGAMIDTCVLVDPISGNIQRSRMDVQKDYTVTLNYLSVSLLPTYRFENLFFYFGPTASIPVSRRIEENNTITGESPCYYLAPGEDTTRTITGALTNTDNVNTRFSVKLGLGYMFEVTPSISIVPQLALDLGLNDAMKEDEVLRMVNPLSPQGTNISVPINRQIRVSSLQGTIGLRIHL